VEALRHVHIKPHAFHGEWNYEVPPDKSER
jgi:hypothetical protein